MKTQLHERFESGLPVGDDHPYRSGPWRPQTDELDAWDLEVEGTIPDDLAGVYLRNTENPLLPPVERYHPFDGDGMLHAISFGGGEATYRNRFVRTDAFLAERDAGESLWAGFHEQPSVAVRDDGWIARPGLKDASSTDVIVHRGEALSSFWACGDLYRFDPETLEARGKLDLEGRFPEWGISAHPKHDHRTGELLFFSYAVDAPYLRYGVVSPDGDLVREIDVPVPGPRLPHDMAFTEHYAIVNDCPMFWDPQALEHDLFVPRFHQDLPTRFGIVPRRGTSDEVTWFEADPTYVLHWINAYEDGDEIVLDGFFQDDPLPAFVEGASLDENLLRHLDLAAMGTRPHRWRFDLRTGACREERLSDRVMEFPAVDSRRSGRRLRYSYNALGADGWFGFRGLVKQDLDTGVEQVLEMPDGVYLSEVAVAPRLGSTAEDDAYLITFTIDMLEDRSQCLVLDAADPTAEPIARIDLPERISSGTHACWSPTDDAGGARR